MIRRETYLPLDTLKTKPINDQLRQIGGTAKLVLDVIKYDPQEIKVYLSLFIFIILNFVNKHATKYRFSCSFITIYTDFSYKCILKQTIMVIIYAFDFT